MFPGSPTDKILALCFKTKGQDNLEPGSSRPRLCPAGLAPLFRARPGASRNPRVPGFVGTFFPYSFPRGKKKCILSQARTPEPPPPVARNRFSRRRPKNPRSTRLSVKGPGVRRPLLPARGALATVFSAPTSRSQVRQPGSSRLGRRQNPERSSPGKPHLPIPVLRLGRPRFGVEPRIH